jgi:hypothetical protein
MRSPERSLAYSCSVRTEAIALLATLSTIFAAGCRLTTPIASSSSHGESPTGAGSSESIDDHDVYEIYRTVLGAPIRQKLMLADQTYSYQPCDLDRASQRNILVREAVADFRSQNAKPRPLNRDILKIDSKIEFISGAGLDQMFSAGPVEGWSSFYRAHPDTKRFVRLSAVGFSRDRTFAIVFMENACGSLCGSDFLLKLSKTSGKWQGDGTLCGAIS